MLIIGILLQQSLALQAAAYMSTEQLKQIVQLIFIRRLDALKPEPSVLVFAS